MKQKYNSSLFNKIFSAQGEEQINIDKNPQTVEELVVQIEVLNQRIKQLEIEQAWSQKTT